MPQSFLNIFGTGTGGCLITVEKVCRARQVVTDSSIPNFFRMLHQLFAVHHNKSRLLFSAILFSAMIVLPAPGGTTITPISSFVAAPRAGSWCSRKAASNWKGTFSFFRRWSLKATAMPFSLQNRSSLPAL